MAEQEQNIQFKFERSPDYRRVHSDYFFFRFSPGEGSITFSQFESTPGTKHQDVCREEVTVSMPWTSLKMLAEYINTALQELERETGPVITVGITREELQKQAAAVVKGFAIRKK